MIIRFLLLLFIASISVLWGLHKSHTLLSELNYQEGMLTLIQTIKRGILCYRTPIYEILQSFPDNIFENTEIVQLMRSRGIKDGYCENCDYFGYDVYTDRRLSDFFNRLGSLTVSEQILMCEEILEILTSVFEKKRAEYPAQRKLYITLGVTIGLGIVIMFL